MKVPAYGELPFQCGRPQGRQERDAAPICEMGALGQCCLPCCSNPPASFSVDMARLVVPAPRGCGEEGSGVPSVGGSEDLCGHFMSGPSWAVWPWASLPVLASIFSPFGKQTSQGTLHSSWCKDSQQEPCWDQWPWGEELIVAWG